MPWPGSYIVTGWTTPKYLVSIAVHAGSTEQVTYDGPPLEPPPMSDPLPP